MATGSSSKRPNEPPPRPGTAAKVRLGVAAFLLFSWLSWLAYLAITATRPIVLSRPQFLVSTLDVIADLGEADGHANSEVKIYQVHWPPSGQAGLVDKTITVTNLSRSSATGGWTFPDGWKGPGQYILPLVVNGDNYRVAAVPLSPGYEPAHPQDLPPRIYPVTPETLHQLEEIPKPDAGEPGK